VAKRLGGEQRSVTIKVEKPAATKDPAATKTVAKTEPAKEKKDKPSPAKEKADSEIPMIKVEKATVAKEPRRRP
jgi:hypothetical protein